MSPERAAFIVIMACGRCQRWKESFSAALPTLFCRRCHAGTTAPLSACVDALTPRVDGGLLDRSLMNRDDEEARSSLTTKN